MYFVVAFLVILTTTLAAPAPNNAPASAPGAAAPPPPPPPGDDPTGGDGGGGGGEENAYLVEVDVVVGFEDILAAGFGPDVATLLAKIFLGNGQTTLVPNTPVLSPTSVGWPSFPLSSRRWHRS